MRFNQSGSRRPIRKEGENRVRCSTDQIVEVENTVHTDNLQKQSLILYCPNLSRSNPQRKAGLKDGGQGSHVDLPFAWTDLSQLAQCKGHIQEGSISPLLSYLIALSSPLPFSMGWDRLCKWFTPNHWATRNNDCMRFRLNLLSAISNYVLKMKFPEKELRLKMEFDECFSPLRKTDASTIHLTVFHYLYVRKFRSDILPSQTLLYIHRRNGSIFFPMKR